MTSQSNQPFREVRSEREGGASALLFVHCTAPIMSKDNSFILCGQFMNFKFFQVSRSSSSSNNFIVCVGQLGLQHNHRHQIYDTGYINDK